MKKTVFVFCLIVSIFLCGCSITKSTDNNQLTDPINTEQVIGCSVKGLIFKTYLEYLDFLDEYIPQYKCIKNMIKYDSLSCIGEYKGFVTNSYLSPQDDGLSDYHYEFQDLSKTELFLTITDWSKKEIKKGEVKKLGNKLKQNDMRMIDEVKNGYYLVDDLIKYYYIGGKLIDVQWIYNGLEFTLSSINNDLYNYPYGYDTFMARLLDANKAAEAINELTAEL